MVWDWEEGGGVQKTNKKTTLRFYEHCLEGYHIT
jgi:hypothetical protein